MSLQIILYRFLIGGLIVAVIPIVGKAFGPKLGGMVMLVPAITILSLYYIGKTQESRAISTAAIGGLWGLIPLSAFLLVIVLTGTRLPSWVVFAGSLAVWALVVATLNWAGLPGALALAHCVAGGMLLRIVNKPYTFVMSFAVMTASLITLIIMSAAYGTRQAPVAVLCIIGAICALAAIISACAMIYDMEHPASWQED